MVERHVLSGPLQLPISYGDARPLLESLGGPEAPEDFVGGLNITYHTGPSKKGLAVQLTVSASARKVGIMCSITP